MLKCILGDGSVFEGDRSKLSKISEVIKDMLDDPFEKSNSDSESDELENGDISNLMVPLPLVPSYQRMKNVVENTTGLPLIDLIYKINDADYLNCQGVMETCFDELVQIIENGTEENLEMIIEHTVPTVLGAVLLRVNCISVIENYLINFNSFPLPRHLHIVMEGCGVLQSKNKLDFTSVCKIMLYCVSIAPNEKSEKYINEYITTTRNILNGNFNDHPRETLIYGAILNDINLVSQMYDPHKILHENPHDNYELLRTVGNMGRMEIADLLLKDKNYFWLNHFERNYYARSIFNSACSAGLTYFPKQLMNRFEKSEVQSFSPDAIIFLLKENYKFLREDNPWFYTMLGSVLFGAVEEDNIEFCKVISKHFDFSQAVMCSEQDDAPIVLICTDHEIMRMLYEAYDKKELSSLSIEYWQPIEKKKFNWIFGTYTKYDISSAKILWDVQKEFGDNYFDYGNDQSEYEDDQSEYENDQSEYENDQSEYEDDQSEYEDDQSEYEDDQSDCDDI